MSDGNWFQRHLNWTLVISLASFNIIAVIVGFTLGLISEIIAPSVSDETIEGYSYALSFIISLTFIVPVGLWILERKGRSLWHILWLYIPIGLIIFFLLENEKKLPPTPNRIRGKGVVISLVATTSTAMCLGVIAAIMSFVYLSGEIFEPSYDSPVEEVLYNPKYWNTGWEDLDYELQLTAQAVSAEYYKAHTYIEGETDCNDMVVDIWNMLYTEGIISIIVIGNHDVEGEYFADCDHSWLLICDSTGASFALEATEGLLIFSEDVENEPSLDQYWEGYFYTKPSDLKEDILWRW